MNEHMPTCCSCHSASLNFVLSLGQIPDFETFLSDSACSRGLTAYPLVVFFCSECALMQIAQPSPLAARLRRQQCQHDDLGAFVAQSQCLDLVQLAALGRLDERLCRLRLPWLHAG